MTDRHLQDVRRRAYRSMGLDVAEAMSIHADRADHIRMLMQDNALDAWDLTVRQYDGIHIATWSGYLDAPRALVIDDTDTDEQIVAKIIAKRKAALPTEFEAKARAVYQHHAPSAGTLDRFMSSIATGANGSKDTDKA